MNLRPNSGPEVRTNSRKRALKLIIDVKEEVFSLRCLTKNCSSQVQSSNLGGDVSTSDESSESSNENIINNGVEECTTPKAEEYRIPKVMTCPPAPRKRKLTSSHHCSVLPSSSSGFFCPADLELLFMPRHNITSRI